MSVSNTRSRVEISRGCQQTCNISKKEATVPRKGSCTCMHDAERVVSRTESRTIDLSGFSGSIMLPSHSRMQQSLRFLKRCDSNLTCQFFKTLKNCLCQDKVNQPRNWSNSGCILCPFGFLRKGVSLGSAGRIKTSRTF